MTDAELCGVLDWARSAEQRARHILKRETGTDPETLARVATARRVLAGAQSVIEGLGGLVIHLPRM